MTKSDRDPDVSAILTLHREGLICAPSIKSLKDAVDFCEANLSLSCQIIVVMDRSDELTRELAQSTVGDTATIVEVDAGDPAASRNRGIELAVGTCSTFLDGDDLWSYNWISEAWTNWQKRPDAIFHSACNVVFGDGECLWWHRDSEDPSFDPGYLSWANYWDAMSFASTDIYRKFPYRRNDLKLGFGHEDWHWNCLTYSEGLPHKPVPGTAHFKRRRGGSQMSLVRESGSVVWPLTAK